MVNTGDNLAHQDSVGPLVEGFGALLDVPGVFVFGSNDYFAPSMHGTINHGEQFLDPTRRDLPTTYYGRNSGVGLAIREAQAARRTHRRHRIGHRDARQLTAAPAITSAFTRSIRWSSTSPIPNSASLKDCKAKLDIALGDARLSLEREPSEQFDVLAVDAFSGDSIPVHLLTKEAFDLYFRHLKPGGVLAVHVSNKYLDLEPVVHGIASALGKQDRTVDTDETTMPRHVRSHVGPGHRPRRFLRPRRSCKADRATVGTRRGMRLWTDDYSNLFQILK